jgi:hypothetical protein
MLDLMEQASPDRPLLASGQVVVAMMSGRKRGRRGHDGHEQREQPEQLSGSGKHAALLGVVMGFGLTSAPPAA